MAANPIAVVHALLEDDDPYAGGDPYPADDPYAGEDPYHEAKVAYRIVADDPEPYGVASQTMLWRDEDDAGLTFTVAGDTAYILGIRRGNDLNGSEMLRQFRAGPAIGKRVKAVGAAPDTVGFWDKMQDRGLIDDWTDTDPESFFEVDDENLDESAGGKAGVYADLTGPKPQYYVKCPECGHVHGMYPSFAAAQLQQVCGTCRFEKVMKYRSDLEKLGRPKKRQA